MKYIVLKVTMEKGHEIKIPFIFPELLVHAMVAEQMTRVIRKSIKNIESIEPLSAGFLSSMDIESNCHGKSESMGALKSRREDDDELISGCDYGSMHL